eukprot:3860211-Rhodomonas_salina.1
MSSGVVAEQLLTTLSVPLLPDVVLAGQEIHTASAEDEPPRNCPDRHVEHVTDAVAAYDPAGHSTHAPEPDESLKVPAAHAVQLPPPGPLKPGLQKQCSNAELPGADTVPGGQARHELDVRACDAF